MWFESTVRNGVRRLLTGERSIALERGIPSLEGSFQGIDEFGLYLHVPFCRQICPYCPYNKELYDPQIAGRYADAVLKEIDVYARLVGDRPVTSFYIGGGTPTTMLDGGLDRILGHVASAFNLQCGIHMESHPNDLSPAGLDTITAMGVEHLSIGVEALQDHHLRALRRPYTVDDVKAAVARAVDRGFRCVNADFIFALPKQTCAEVERAGHELVELGVDQVAAYPLFHFSYTGWPDLSKKHGYRRHGVLKKRKMLRVLERVFYGAGFERTSVWAFTRRGVPRYCSVTVPLYVGLGPSGGTYLNDVFYLNTFNVGAYCAALESGRMPIALSVDLTERMQMAGWLYWRIYETRFRKADFRERFGRDFDEVYGRPAKLLARLGMLEAHDGQVVLSDGGAYWLHALQDLFSLDYVDKLWGDSKRNPWPERVVL
jgi:oxygen-independent coproporphyrinogen-3 oxidase